MFAGVTVYQVQEHAGCIASGPRWPNQPPRGAGRSGAVESWNAVVAGAVAWLRKPVLVFGCRLLLRRRQLARGRRCLGGERCGVGGGFHPCEEVHRPPAEAAPGVFGEALAGGGKVFESLVVCCLYLGRPALTDH